MTPVYAFVAATIVNIGLKFALMQPLGHVGLAAATSVGVTLYAVLLLVLLLRRRHIRLGWPGRSGKTSD
jgi:putative peptidoglycan lipid II flippase